MTEFYYFLLATVIRLREGVEKLDFSFLSTEIWMTFLRLSGGTI